MLRNLGKSQKIILSIWVVLLLVPTRMMLKTHLELADDNPLLVGLNTVSELPHISHRWGMFEKLPVIYRIPSYTDENGKEVIATRFVKTPSLGYKRSRVTLMSTMGLNYIRQLCYDKPADIVMNLTIYAQTETDVAKSDWDYYPYKRFFPDACMDRGAP